MTQFHVGQRVVCVDDAQHDETIDGVNIVDNMDGLKKGSVYTIRSIYIDPIWGLVLVRLCEIKRLPLSFVDGWYFESGYDPERFRPLMVRKTDISQFKAMLNPQKTEVTA